MSGDFPAAPVLGAQAHEPLWTVSREAGGFECWGSEQHRSKREATKHSFVQSSELCGSDMHGRWIVQTDSDVENTRYSMIGNQQQSVKMHEQGC